MVESNSHIAVINTIINASTNNIICKEYIGKYINLSMSKIVIGETLEIVCKNNLSIMDEIVVSVDNTCYRNIIITTSNKIWILRRL